MILLFFSFIFLHFNFCFAGERPLNQSDEKRLSTVISKLQQRAHNLKDFSKEPPHDNLNQSISHLLAQHPAEQNICLVQHLHETTVLLEQIKRSLNDLRRQHDEIQKIIRTPKNLTNYNVLRERYQLICKHAQNNLDTNKNNLSSAQTSLKKLSHFNMGDYQRAPDKNKQIQAVVDEEKNTFDAMLHEIQSIRAIFHEPETTYFSFHSPFQPGTERLNISPDAYGMNVLHHTVKSGNKESVKAFFNFLQIAGNKTKIKDPTPDSFFSDEDQNHTEYTDINRRDNMGNAPIHYACDNGSLEVVTILIEQGADLTICDAQGNTPFMRALAGRKTDLLRYIFEKNKEFELSHLQRFPDEFIKILQNAPSELISTVVNSIERIELLEDQKKPFIEEFLMRKDLDETTVETVIQKLDDTEINTLDNAGYTLLDHVLKKKNYAKARLLILRGALISQRGSKEKKVCEGIQKLKIFMLNNNDDPSLLKKCESMIGETEPRALGKTQEIFFKPTRHSTPEETLDKNDLSIFWQNLKSNKLKAAEEIVKKNMFPRHYHQKNKMKTFDFSQATKIPWLASTSREGKTAFEVACEITSSNFSLLYCYGNWH